MTAYLTKKRAAFAAMSIFGIVVLSGGALAITDNVFSYSNPKTGYYGIDHMGMVPDSTAAADNYGMDWGDGLQAGTGLCFVNGVHLPQGAKVTAVTVWYEGGSGASLHAELTRHKFSDGVSATLAIANLTDSTTVRTSGALAVTAANATIDDRMYSYAFGICLHSGNFFHAARITYKYDNAGD